MIFEELQKGIIKIPELYGIDLEKALKEKGLNKGLKAKLAQPVW